MEFLQNSCSVLRDRKRTQDPVAIAKWTHLNSSRTQKLSTFTATIVGLAPAKIASCRVLFFFLLYSKAKSFIYLDLAFFRFINSLIVFSNAIFAVTGVLYMNHGFF